MVCLYNFFFCGKIRSKCQSFYVCSYLACSMSRKLPAVLKECFLMPRFFINEVSRPLKHVPQRSSLQMKLRAFTIASAQFTLGSCFARSPT